MILSISCFSRLSTRASHSSSFFGSSSSEGFDWSVSCDDWVVVGGSGAEFSVGVPPLAWGRSSSRSCSEGTEEHVESRKRIYQ